MVRSIGRQGTGGVFQCPSNPAAWAGKDQNTNAGWGFGPPNDDRVGDETTRYPRSYAINSEAGCNELGQANGQCRSVFPNVGDTNPEGGTEANLDRPASTIAIAETRMDLDDTKGEFSAYECTSEGRPAGSTGYSCQMGHPGGFFNAIFFDGHAKSVRALQAIRDDNWDIYGTNGYGTGTGNKQQGWAATNAAKIKQWQ